MTTADETGLGGQKRPQGVKTEMRVSVVSHAPSWDPPLDGDAQGLG